MVCPLYSCSNTWTLRTVCRFLLIELAGTILSQSHYDFVKYIMNIKTRLHQIILKWIARDYILLYCERLDWVSSPGVKQLKTARSRRKADYTCVMRPSVWAVGRIYWSPTSTTMPSDHTLSSRKHTGANHTHTHKTNDLGEIIDVSQFAGHLTWVWK